MEQQTDNLYTWLASRVAQTCLTVCFKVKKAASAVFKGTDYEQDLLESFESMKSASRHLIHEAQNSHIHETSAMMNRILRGNH